MIVAKDLKKQVEKLENELFAKHRKAHYRGKPTKDFQRLYKLREQMEYFDNKRNVIFLESMQKMGINFNGF